jgi:hypothetical protein
MMAVRPAARDPAAMRSWQFLTAVPVLAAAVVVSLPGAAAAGPGGGAEVDGYVWADRASTPSYTVTNGYWHNSTGGAVRIDRPAAGVYAVRFEGMAAAGGVAHARPYGSGSTAICTVAGWAANGADQVVNVRCFDAAGAPADTRFAASFTNRAAVLGTFAYLWAERASPALDVAYTPSPSYSYDVTGVAPQVWRQSTGVYMMVIGAVDAHYPLTHHDGVYQITAYGKHPVRCEVHGENDEDPTPIGVFCVDPAGAPADSRFAVTYAHSLGVTGTGADAANAHYGYSAADPVGSWYLNGYWNPGGAPALTRFSPGRYRVTFPGLAVPGGHAYAGSRGNPSSACNVARWSPGSVDVHCFDHGTGLPADSEFNVAITA